jgi:hypothetical protein
MVVEIEIVGQPRNGRNGGNGNSGDSPESTSLYSDEIPSGYNSGEQVKLFN